MILCRHEGGINNNTQVAQKYKKSIKSKLHPLAHSGLYGEGHLVSSPEEGIFGLQGDALAGTIRPISQRNTESNSDVPDITGESSKDSAISIRPRVGGVAEDSEIAGFSGTNDIGHLRDSVKISKSKASQRALRKKLEVEEQNMQHQLHEEEASLSTIQAMKKSLERQLASMKVEQEVDEVISQSVVPKAGQFPRSPKKSSPRRKSPKSSPLKSQNMRLSVESDGYQDDFEELLLDDLTSVTHNSPRKIDAMKEKDALLKSMVHSPTSKAGSAAFIDSTKRLIEQDSSGPRTGTAIGTAAGLQYSKADVGKFIEMFSFRFRYLFLD